MRIDIPAVLVDLRAQVVDAHRGDRRPKAEALAMKATGAAFGSARRLALGERLAGLAGRVLKRDQPSARRLGLDGRPRPAGAAARVVPRLVEADPDR